MTQLQDRHGILRSALIPETNRLNTYNFYQMRNISINSKPLFGEAIAFYTVTTRSTTEPEVLVAYRPLIHLHQVLRRWQGIFSEEIVIAKALSIEAIIGIWEGIRTKKVHILRKHPGVDLLKSTEQDDGSEEEEFDLDAKY